MWLLAFAVALQLAVIFELVLNRIIAVLCNVKRNPVRKLADGSFCGSLLALVMSALTVPVSIAAAAAQIFVSYFFFWVGLLCVIAVLAAVCETSSTLVVLYVNAYNSGVGQALNELLVLLFELVAPFWRAVVPLYNALVYMLVGFSVDVLLPIVFVNAKLLPDLIVNFTVMLGSLGAGVHEWFQRLSLCAQHDARSDNATSPFWVNDLSCVGSAHYLTLDLMTPALYAQRSATALQAILTTSCVPVTNALALLMYPLLDVNLYKALHGLVNAVLHTLVALPLLTRNRCEYAHTTADYEYTDVEKQVMCTPDVAPLAAVLVSAVKSAGMLVDNWLDSALVLVENSVTGVGRSCAATPLPLVWNNASAILGTSELQVVGLTPSLYAFTDADSIVYHSMVGASLRVAYALHVWPFRIDLRFGVAAVSYNAVPDVDDEGNGRTGMLGCKCVDSEAGMQIMCASVPFQQHAAEDEADLLESTVHRVRFVPDSASVGLTCAQVTVRVEALRFSRRRFSAPGAGRVELGFGDEFNTRLQYGLRLPAAHTADAAIIVTPSCAVHASVLCVPSIENCFPFCLGLHAAGQRTQNISLMNAQRWDEWTSLGQTDCVVASAVGGACISEGTSLVRNEEAGVAISGCGQTACLPDAASVTFVKNSQAAAANRSLVAWQAQQPWGFVRSRLQPFVVAGDVFLYRHEETDTSGQILVTRLYDNKRGDFSLQQEKLSLVTNTVALQYYQCSDEACYRRQLRENRVVLPDEYFVDENLRRATASEWAVHWTATPSSSKCALLADFCAQTSRDEALTYEAHRPRLWTVRTVRHTERLGMAYSEEALVSYMVVPDWLACGAADIEQAQCARMYNVRVAGLEYINADNLLLTVLAARPGDWDWQNERVFAGRPSETRFYFVHPNRHDCTSADDQETMYTCWRSADEGMFSAPASSVSETGALCPALQRMPRWGSMVAEVVVAQVYLLKFLLEALFVLPLAFRGGFGDVFGAHPPTFQSVLDASGGTLFDLEDALQAMQLSAFHAAGVLARTGTLMQTLGAPELETVLVGSARVFEYTKAASMVEDAVFGQTSSAASQPYSRLVTSFGATTTESAPLPTPGAPAALAVHGSSRWLLVFQAMTGPSVSWVRVTVKIVRKVVVRALRSGQLRRLVARDLVSGLLAAVYESEQDMARGLFDNMKTVCDASGQVFGRTNAWGQSVRHACLVVPEAMQAVVRVVMVLTVDYQVMDCACKQTDGFVVEEVLSNVCLPRILPMARKAFVMRAITDRSTSACFAVMDSVNDRLLRAFDPVFARMVKAQASVESAFGLLVTQALGLDALDMRCTEYDSPYVVSILPEPVDYFMGCMHTFDCRARCLDTMQAFDDALVAYKAHSAAPLAYVSQSSFETESRYFSYADMEAGRHLAPFAVYAVALLPETACSVVCPKQQARCVAVGGLRRGVLAVAYYCVPASLVVSVYEGIPPPNATAAFADVGSSLLDVQFATVHQRELGCTEWLVVLVGDERSEHSVWVLPSGVPGAAWRVLETRAYNPLTTVATPDLQDPAWTAETIRAVRVVPAHASRGTASVFVVGTTRAADGQADASFCFYVLVDTSADGALDRTRHACSSAPGTVASDTHETVCVDYDCVAVVRVPVDGSTEVRLETLTAFAGNATAFDWTVASTRTLRLPQDQRKLLDVDHTARLSTSQDSTLQVTRRRLSLFGAVTKGAFGEAALTIDVPLTGRGQAEDSWLQNVRLQLAQDETADLRVSASFTTQQRLETVVNCSVASCVGCHGAHPLQVDLQNKCFAAAACGVAKCVGTAVNMKRPLCQIAGLLGLQLAMVRVNFQGFWDYFSRSVITVVELTQSRRQLYEISTPQETTMAMVCSLKDGIVETAATFGSLFALVPAMTLDRASREPLSLQELRLKTEEVMVATAVVQLLSQIWLAVVYVPLVLAKSMQCQLNDAFLVIEGIGEMVAQGTTKQDVVKFRMGSKKLDAVDDFAVGMCLSDRFKQDMRDIADPSRAQSMLSGLQDVIDGITGLVLSYRYATVALSLDGLFAWVLGVLTSIANLVQVVNPESCRLPATDAIVAGSCVCGDVPAKIPDRQRSSRRTDALWCRGPLMMNNLLGNDLLVWNPYTLAELIAQNNVQAYFDCLGEWAGDMRVCASRRPVSALFEAQGVDVLQVIIRCRSNYQQKRWDEGAVALGLLEHAADWAPAAVQTKALVSMYTQAASSFETLRKRLAQISEHIDGIDDLDRSSFACLRVALFANQWNHNCAELALAGGLFEHADSLLTYFVYSALPAHALFEHTDACETFSGGLTARSSAGASYPRMAWDGDSQNTVPVAELHNKVQGSTAQRIAQAETQLRKLVREKIEPAFAELAAVPMRDIEAEFWALEGDSLHQAVDCVVLGPFAAADMLPMHKTLRDAFQTPQYHRGDARSREIAYGLRTQGSPARKNIIREVVRQTSAAADEALRALVRGVVDSLRAAYTQPSNLYCTCLGDAAPSLECCVSNRDMHTDLRQFGTTFAAQAVLAQRQDLHGQFTAGVVDEAVQSRVLEDIWLDAAGALNVELSDEQRAVLAQDYAFDYSEPVREYSASEVPRRLNQTLWAHCQQSLESVFFTMPLRGEFGATVDADSRYDASSSTEADAARYMHGMERVIETLLDKAKLHSPTYWSHVHRYMPSDSVWCEETSMRPSPPQRSATYPAQWNDLELSQTTIAAPQAEELLYVGRLGVSCACGLAVGDGTCALPPGLCAQVLTTPSTGSDNTSRLVDLCAAGTYSAFSDVLLVRRELYNTPDVMPDCAERMPSTAWGLLDTTQQRKWYDGATGAQNVSLQEVAALGPAGFRLAMLLRESPVEMPKAPPADHADAYNAQFEHTVAQPFCRSTQERLFTANLTHYFRDVLFPMAHAVHEAPSEVICGRWVVEYALYVAVLRLTGPTSSATAEQRLVEERWRSRCTYQLEVVGICNLRNVYSLVPPGMQSTAHCKFTLAPDACARFYVTDSCLLMCDGELYDPCLCADSCAVVFSKDMCAGGRRFRPVPGVMDLRSLHWAETVWPPDTVQQRTLDAVRGGAAPRLALHEDMFAFVHKQAAHEEGAAPEAFCDDLIDYMHADAQHPVGYHPTCACDRRETNMRGFDAWMSTVSNSQHAYSIDPVRMRNMSLYSTTFGGAHLACDAAAYSTSGAQLNTLRMQSKWNANARADPAMPVFADLTSEQTMADSQPADDQHDTPLQGSAADELFRHSVGLVRDWLRDHESEKDQAALDAVWPHWLDATSPAPFAAPPAAALHDGCSMPPLLHCFEDSDCRSSDEALRCKRNVFGGAQADPFGICAHVDTCFQHAHCADGKMCAGTGRCEEPRIIVKNDLAKPIHVRISAKSSKQCTGSASGASVFQQAPTFARDNGLCSVYNLFNYRNLTADVLPRAGRTNIKSVVSRNALFVPDAASWLALADADTTDARNALLMQAHPCDRSYEHTDFALCSPDTMRLDAASDPLQTVTSTRTWREQDGLTEIDFCNLHVGAGAFSTLASPYVSYEDGGDTTDTLRNTEATIKKCNKFDICPAPTFTVGGRPVDRLAWDSTGSLAKYPLSHAKRCMAFGLWNEAACRVDALVVPLMRAVFGDADDVKQLDTPFEVLRAQCPAAFGVARPDALHRFQQTYVLLTEPYSPLNPSVQYDRASCERMTDNSIQCVAETINSLALRIFDLRPETRGLADLADYKRKARCATHLYRQLQKVQLDAARRMGALGVAPEDTPGATFYMFSGHFPVEVPLSWFWTCVLVTSKADGGAPENWYTVITNADVSEELQCPNIMRGAAAGGTLREHLQQQPDIYSSESASAYGQDLYDGLLELMRNTVDKWQVPSIPTLVCKEPLADSADNAGECASVKQYDLADKKCWARLESRDGDAASYHQDRLTACADHGKCTLFDVMFHFIFGRSGADLRKNVVLTVDWMVEQHIATRLGLETPLSPLFTYANMIPEIEFERLRDLNASLVASSTPSAYSVDYDYARSCAAPATALDQPEYEIPRPVVDGEGEFRIYNKIFNFQEMQRAKELRNEEVYQSYYAKEDGASVAISQKQMLLLALYYMRETMFLGTTATFGTMRFVPDVRERMQAELAAAQALPANLARTKFYDHVVKAQNFQCPDNKQIADAAASDLQKQLSLCLQDLKFKVGWELPPDGHLVARADADMLLSGFYASFMARQDTGFLDELVDTDWHLKAVPPATRLCFATPTGAAPLMPLWSGMLDLQSCPNGKSCGCQLGAAQDSTFVDLTCDKSADLKSCEQAFPVFYDSVKRAMYDKCWLAQGEFASVAQHEQMPGGNLCSRTPAPESTCRLEFGAQGRATGQPRHDLQRRSTVDRVQRGLFAANSTLFRDPATGATEVTALGLLDTDIGGHSLRFHARWIGRDTERSAVLDLTCVSAGQSCSQASFGTPWLPTIASEWAVQHSAHRLRHRLDEWPGDARAHWQCPLQWLSAYADQTVPYVARSPSADRNRIRFRHITGEAQYAHATVVQTLRVARHPARFLSDHTACVDATLLDGKPRFRCRGRALLLEALAAHRGRWSLARFEGGQTPLCRSMLDWPHDYFGTVDGSRLDKPAASAYCNVFWRLPSFALRYAAVSARLEAASSLKPRAPGSACHMGRLRKLKLEAGSDSEAQDAAQFCASDATSARCRMLRRTFENQTGRVKHSWYDADVTFEPAFVSTRRPAKRQRRCSACDRHDAPSFVDRRSRETPLAGPAQLSVGQTTTVSPERMIAAALRRHVCAPNTDCPVLHDLFDESKWQRGQLLDAMLGLALEHQRAADAQQSASAPQHSDDALWAAPWVLCAREQGEVTCRGSIAKAEWKDPATRIPACVRETSGAAPVSRSSMDFCLLSDETAALCTQIADWNAEITHILCAAGNHPKCAERAFYYNPSQYSASNNAFVYDSVASLYAKLNGSACPAEARAQADSNTQHAADCGSTQLDPVIAIVKLLRLVLRKLVMLLYYLGQVLFAVVGLIVSHLLDVPGATADYFQDNLHRYVHLMLAVIAQAQQQIWQIVWSLFDFGDFSFIKNISIWACLFVQNVIAPIVEFAILPMLAAIVAVVNFFDKLLCPPAGCNRSIADSLAGTQARLRGFRPACSDANNRTRNYKGTALPAATRCWATYTTYFGDSGRLSCTEADTCRLGMADSALVTCGACVSFADYAPFGCDDVTKTCTCNLPLLAEQGCEANEECAAPDATCRFVDRELQPSIGLTSCAACQTRRVCLLAPGRASGFCACGLVDLELQRCVAQGRPAMPAYDKLCVYTQDARFLHATSFMFSFYTSMTAPCNDLNPSSSYCARESNDGQLYVVGVDAVRRRHLLGTDDAADMTAADTRNSLCQDSLAGDAMPAHRSACRAAYAYSRETLAQLELHGHLPPCTFCSVEDAVHGLLLQPHNLALITTNLSRVALVVLRHSPMRVLVQSANAFQRHIGTALQIAAAEPALAVQHTNGSWHVEALVDHASVETLAHVLRVVLPLVPRTLVPRTLVTPQAANKSHARRLLTVEDVAEAVQQNFRVSAALRQALATQLASSLDYVFESSAAQKQWMNTWPPKLGAEVLQADLCPPLTNMLRTTRRALGSVDTAYSMEKQAVPAASVRRAWVNVSRRDEVNMSWSDYAALRASHDSVVAGVLFAADRGLAAFGQSPNSIFDVLAAAADEVYHFIRCDYEALQTCSKWHRHVVAASVVVALYYLGVYAVCAAVGLAMPLLLTAVVLPAVVLYLSYGYAPLCFPAVPVCLYDDLVYTLQQLVPKSIALPDVVYKSRQCLSARLDAACLRTCTDEPFAFLEWYDVLSWWSLELGAEAGLAQLVQQPLTSLLLGQQTQDDVQAALLFHARVFDAPDAALLTTKRVCAVLSSYKLVPYVALLFVALMLAGASLQVLLQTANVAFQTTFALFVSAFH